MKRRTVTIWVSAIAGLAVLAGCDTGDGKQLQPYDPADAPIETVAPTTDVEFAVDPSLDLNAEFNVDPDVDTGSLDGPVEPFTVAAPWADGAAIDPRYTCDGLDIAPALSWGAVPPGTIEIAVALVDDSSVGDGQPFVHWVMGGLDPGEIALTEGEPPPGALQALNFFGDVGYGGPCPPPGDEPHFYRLSVFALNQQLELADGDQATEFLDTIATFTIASTDVTGFFQR